MSRVTNVELMFHKVELFDQPLNSWNVKNLIHMIQSVCVCVYFTTLGICSPNIYHLSSGESGHEHVWIVFGRSELQPTHRSVAGNSKKKTKHSQARIFKWYEFYVISIVPQISRVTNLGWMFGYAYNFNQDLSAWDTSRVTNFDFMFGEASVFNSSLSTWDVSSGTTFFEMFNKADVFNSDLNSWDVSSSTSIQKMFMYSTSFNQPLHNWDVSSVSNIESLFYGAWRFQYYFLVFTQSFYLIQLRFQ